jgi:hypothetical protein
MRLAYHQRRPVDRAADEIEVAMLHGGYDTALGAELARRHAARAAGAAPGSGARNGGGGGGGGGSSPGAGGGGIGAREEL